MQKRKDTRLIAREKKKSDRLLMSVLPADVVSEIRQKGFSNTNHLSTVLFADIKSPAKEISGKSREIQEAMKDRYAERLDEIALRYGLEKIKNAGDACLYITEPAEGTANAHNAVEAAAEMLRFVEKTREEHLFKGETYFDVSIGLHSGPLVAGIVGIRRTGHDIWGDTVTMATRMEQHGETGKINVSGITYQLIQDKYHGRHHGKIAGQNNTELDMYLIDGTV
jgi:class 3 adenylate cyclase